MNTETMTSSQLVDEKITFLGRTYGMLALCIAAGSIGTYLSMGMAFPYEHPWMMLGVMIGGIFLVQKVRHTKGLNFVALIGFGAITGMAIAPLVNIVAAKSPTLVLQAFVTTAVAFASLTAYTFISKRDFSFLKGFVWTGLVAMIVLGLHNYFFFESSLLSLTLSGVGVLLISHFSLNDDNKHPA